MSASCPRCHSSFTIAEDEQVQPATHSNPEIEKAARPSIAGPANALETQPTAILDETRSIEPPRQAPMAAATAPITEFTEPAMVPALIALSVGGVALASSQLPYGRILITALGSFGLLLSLFALLFAERQRKYPLLATATNGLALALALVFPSWLGLAGFLPEAPTEDATEIRAIDFNKGLAIPAGDKVDAQRLSWSQDDVLISIPSVSYVPVDVIGPNGQKRRTKERVLQMTLKIMNAGVARQITFQGWLPPENAPRLSDSQNNAIKPKTFDRGWGPVVQASSAATLFPGKSAEQTLYFDAPRLSGELNLELPAKAFGGTDPVRFTIPISMISAR